MPKKKPKPQVRRRNGWGAGPAPSNNTSQWDSEEYTTEVTPSVDTFTDNRPGRNKPLPRAPRWTSKISGPCTFCLLWCEPPVGFHKEMMQEVHEVFSVPSRRRNTYVTARLGSVTDVHKVRVLRTAEKAFVQAWCPPGCGSLDHCGEPAAQLREIEKAVEWIDWGVALQAWAKYSGRFRGSPFEYKDEWQANPPSVRVCCTIFIVQDGVNPSFREVDAQVGGMGCSCR